MKYDKEKINNLPKIEKIAFIWMLLSAISVFVTGVLRNYFYMFIIMGQALFIISILATIKYKNFGNSVPKIDFKKYIFVGLLGIFIICISIVIKINNINLIKYMPYVFYIILCLLFIFAGCIFAKKLYCNHFYLIKRCKVPVEISLNGYKNDSSRLKNHVLFKYTYSYDNKTYSMESKNRYINDKKEDDKFYIKVNPEKAEEYYISKGNWWKILIYAIIIYLFVDIGIERLIFFFNTII